MKILILNGPNLNLLGNREPEVYGKQGFNTYFETLKQEFKTIELSYFQSNSEGEIVTKLQDANSEFDGVVLNAAAYTHTSVAIADVIKAIGVPVVEVHISNVFQRESFRHHSYISPNAKGIIVGFGLKGYALAIRSFL